MKKSIVMMALILLLSPRLQAIDTKQQAKDAIDATSELESIEHNIILQQELAAEQAFIELQTLLNSLAAALSEQENATEINEHFAALLMIILQNAMSLEAQENPPTCPCVDPAAIIHKTHTTIDVPENNQVTPQPEQVALQQKENRPATVILICYSSLASNLASILAAPRNPLVVSQGIASSIASLIDIIKYAIQASKKDTRTYHNVCAQKYARLSQELNRHFSTLLTHSR